jgi:hypothetical protein
VAAPEVGPAFIPWVGPHLAEILCVQDERVVGKDTPGHDPRPRLQIPQAPHRFHDVNGTVRVHEYPDGTLAVFHGPRCLARDRAEGHLLGQPRPQLSSGGRCLTRPAFRSSIVDQI